MQPCTLTLDDARQILTERGGGLLRRGNHAVLSGTACEMCVRELRAVACGLDWTDHPDGDSASPTDRACQILNDANWSSDAARTDACLPLALLSEATAPKGWVKVYVEQTIRQIVPSVLRVAAVVHRDRSHRDALEDVAKRCEQEGTPTAAYAARAAARAADAADAARAAAYAADAADAAAYAVDAADVARAAARAADAARAAGGVLYMSISLLLKAHGRQDLIIKSDDDLR